MIHPALELSQKRDSSFFLWVKASLLEGGGSAQAETKGVLEKSIALLTSVALPPFSLVWAAQEQNLFDFVLQV